MKALNPTRTKKIEKAWFTDISKRYSSLQKDIDEKLRELVEPIQVNATLGLNAEQQKVFMAWLLQRIEEVTGDSPPLNWQNQYQLESYLRAVERTRASLISQGAELSLTDQERMLSQGLTFTATPTLGSQAVAATIHQDALEFIFTRAYESLKGWNDAFVKDVRQITFDAVRNGTGIRELTDQIKERTGVTSRRAELIARTETNQAYNIAALNETERASEELGEEILNRWISALSPTTRHRHASWHGSIVDAETVRKRKQPPNNYNCKCSIVPVIKGAGDTPAKNAKFKDEKQQYMKWEEDQGK